MSCCCDLVHDQGGLSCMYGNSVEDVCSKSIGALSTGVNSISVKKWCTFPKEIKITNKNCVVGGETDCSQVLKESSLLKRPMPLW